MKKFLAILLTICLLAAALPVSASAETSQQNALVNQIRRCYLRTLAATGEPNMDNLCGTFVGYQLYYLGITTDVVLANGSQFYTIYSKAGYTSGGHTIKCYPGPDYTLEQALNAITHNGTKDAYNIMLCFDWTRSGGGYGHVMLIHAIIDGTVYAVDNFTTTMAGPEGTPMIGSIATFADEYDGWSSFEGAIDFGIKEYASMCDSYPTDMFVKATQPALLMSQPSEAEVNDSYPVRIVMPGERLAVTDLMVGYNDTHYYRVREEGKSYYILCDATQPIWLNIDGVQTRKLTLQNTQGVGDPGKMTGEVISTGCAIGAVELVITNQAGFSRSFPPLTMARFNHNLRDMGVNFSTLDRGVYTVELYATLWQYYDRDGEIARQRQRIRVYEDTLLIGDVEAPEAKAVTTFAPGAKQGWQYEQGVWRCYRNGQPRTGWYCYEGVDYYLQEDGSVTTGWANINGEDRFFSDTGAMRTGWMIEPNGDVRYMMFNGVSAKGWREIDGAKYYFDENGIWDEKAVG